MDKIKKLIPIALLIIVFVALAIANYTPGTFLSGWDTLHPEFNFGLSFKRELPGVFRVNQGLGAVAGHSDMADFPHILTLYLLHSFLPMDFLRYAYFFLCLIAGPIGTYLFLYKIVLKNKIASFLGALFYLLNLGTMQQFVVPFEMFATQYATLPWLFLFATNYIYNKERRHIILFAIVTFISAPIAFAATLWYFQFFVFAIYIFILSFRENLKKAFVLICLTILMNLFWILPNLYFVTNYGKDVQNANINKLFSKEAFLYNKEFGNIKDLSLLKNFLFDWSAYSGNGKFTQLLSPWIEHLKKPFVEQIGFLFALMSLGGFIYSIKIKNRVLIALSGPLFLSLLFLINDNPPTAPLYNALKNMPLFSEAFRFPQDKTLGIFTFTFTVYFATFQLILLKFFKKKLILIYTLVIILLISYFMFPAFKGNFISPHMKVEIPQQYFELFNWLKNQDKTARIANLPIYSQWGWEYHNWHEDKKPSFQGAGFMWFGIEQPLLNRDFDRWDPANEQYYREMSQAIYSKDSTKLTNVLKKYNITYILVDKSIIDPEQGKNPEVLFFPEIEILLTESPIIKKVTNFGNLFVYQTNFGNQQIKLIKNPPAVGPSALSFYDDFAYLKYQDYITYPEIQRNAIFYPFRDIIDNQNKVLPKVKFPSLDKTVEQNISRGQTINDCSPSIQKGSKTEKEILFKNSEKFVRYFSLSGSFCDHYAFPNLPRNQGYLISITSRNITGLPLKICVTNYLSRRCDIYAQLSQFSAFKEETFLLPPIDESVGFDINFNNFAIAKSPSANDIKSIKVIPFSYSQLSQVERHRLVGNPKETNAISLSQSFDDGWKAYQVKNSKLKVQSWINNALPFLFGKELKSHVLVNNWANGWILDSQFSSLDSQLIIIFLPQYLEYLGLGILIATCIWLALIIRTRT